MMAGIRGKNTRPELLIRRELHRLGFRYRLHCKSLPGKPDLVLPRYQAVLFVHGCFWHGHGCNLFKWPTSRQAFWRDKIERNRERDVFAYQLLTCAGWRVGEVWECALKGPNRLDPDEVATLCAEWLSSSLPNLEIRGTQ